MDADTKQTNFWDEEEASSEVCDPENNRLKEFAQQNQDLRLLSPIYRIEQNKGKLSATPDSFDQESKLTNNIDMIYLSILTLEYYASYALSRDSITASEVIKYLEGKVLLMSPSLTKADKQSIAIYVHNSLCNFTEGYKSFSYSFFDPEKQKMHRYEFWLIKIVSVESGNSCKISEEGITALLTYINANPLLESDLTALLTQKLIETGRFQEAIQMAERSRKTVIQYQERISSATDKVRRESKAGEITKTVLPIINESTKHIQKRIVEEDSTLNSLGELKYDKLDTNAIKLVTKLKSAIRNNLHSYENLFKHIENKHKEFESIFRTLLRPTTGNIPNIVHDLLKPMCQWNIETLSRYGDEISSQIMPAKIPSIFDVMIILDKLDIDGEQQYQKAFKDEEPEMKEIIRVKKLFSEEMIGASKAYYQKVIQNNTSIYLHQLLKNAEKENFSYEFQRCLAYVVLMSYTDEESIEGKSLGIEIEKKEQFQHHFITGDNLLITKADNNHDSF